MQLSVEAIVAIVAMVVTLPTTILMLWRTFRRPSAARGIDDAFGMVQACYYSISNSSLVLLNGKLILIERYIPV